MKKLSYILLTCLMFFTLFTVAGTFGANTVFADDPRGFKAGQERVGSDIAGSDSGLAQDLTISKILTNVINWLLALVALLALLAIIIGGIVYILSIGNDTKTAWAKKIILYAILGLLIVGISFAIIAAIQTLLTGEELDI